MNLSNIFVQRLIQINSLSDNEQLVPNSLCIGMFGIIYRSKMTIVIKISSSRTKLTMYGCVRNCLSVQIIIVIKIILLTDPERIIYRTKCHLVIKNIIIWKLDGSISTAAKFTAQCVHPELFIEIVVIKNNASINWTSQ
jgi:hypothetical protein